MLAILIFVPAGTLDYWRGWVFIIVFTVATNLIGVYLALKDPALLERRKKAGPSAETRAAQKIIMWLLILGCVAMLVVCAFDHRFGWSHMPPVVSLLGNALAAIGLFIDFLVVRENSYSAATIKTMEGQKVISTGPYALVRHPMYGGALVMIAGVPLAPGLMVGTAGSPVLRASLDLADPRLGGTPEAGFARL